MGLWICQSGNLGAVQANGLRPNGYDDGVVGIAWVQEEKGMGYNKGVTHNWIAFVIHLAG